MKHLNKLLNKAQKNGNKINIDDIDVLKLEEQEYQQIVKELSSRGIIIEEEEAFEINLKTEREEYIITDEVQKLLTEISVFPLLTKEEEQMLFCKYNQTGDKEIRQKIINSNLKLVVNVAKKYKRISNSLTLTDLFGEGCIGLLKAVEKFDVTMGYKFSTYATWWIRQSITRSIADNDKTIRIPVHNIETINKMKKFQDIYMRHTGEEPSYAEYSKAVGISEEEVKHLLLSSQNLVSLDKLIGEESDTTLLEMIKMDTDLEQEIVDKLFLQGLMDTIKSVLTDREFYVIMRRLELVNNKASTLEGIGRDLGVTRERVRQIEAKAYRKIKRKLESNEKIKNFIR